jgi:hypothetical protein
MSEISKYKPCKVGERRNGTVWISFGDPESGPHYQCDFGEDIEIANAVANAFNAHNFTTPEPVTPPKQGS